jgi:SPX domain protein involved in polyphosphate accumulation
MAIEIFRRKEQKYLITLEQYERLIDRISSYMRPDKFGQNGKYTVTSLYFESSDRKIYFETKNKLKYRQKLRLRVYNDTDISGIAFFEIKQKHKKVVNKRRVLLPLQEAYRYINLEEDYIDNYKTSNTQILREIDYFRNLYQLVPEMIVSYGRHPLHCLTDSDLRITFDFNLKCRNNDLSLENGAYGNYFIDSNLVVLEVKVNESVPLWLTRILQGLNCEQRSASKFCTSLELLKENILINDSAKENVLIGGM